ncbi:MAG: helix-turn-helix transcriptional regulator [Anaerolineales bacterium]|nr:helix-turn-helix transcriptional regulator [Anaerolineales bacterium]
MSILSSKLQMPLLRPDLVQRSRLIDYLNAGLYRKLTLISAPAGFGKTTVASTWIAQSNYPTAWLSLDGRDNDSARFLRYIIAAIQRIDADIGQLASEVLQAGQQSSIEAVLTSLLNEIAVIPDDFWLVLDDYHLLESPEIDDALRFLLEHLPAQMHLVIITREDPQLPLSRLRVRDQLTELRVADLRFTVDEAAEFLNHAMGLTLSAQDIDALEKRTEGWVAGLQLAALSLQGRTDATDFIQAFTGSHRFIVDYLLEEVLHRQSETMREFLLYTSILGQMNGSLCDAVTQRNDSQKVLEVLERSNLFVIALDDERGWYRYHHLFGDALYNALNNEYPEHIPVLHRWASDWYVKQGQLQEAIEHALLANDFKQAADLIETIWPKMDENYQSGQWFEWASRLPEAVVLNHPILCLGYGWVKLLHGDLDMAEIWFQRAERWLDAPSEQHKQMAVIDQRLFEELPASICHARGYRALTMGDIQTAVQFAAQSLRLNRHHDHPNYGRGLVLHGLAQLANGDLIKADQTFSDFTAYMEAAGNIMDATELVFIIGDIRITLGRLHDAYHAYNNAFQFLARQGNPSVIGLEDLYRGIADVYLMRNQLVLAEENLLAAEELGEQGIIRPNWQSRLYATQAQLEIAQGDFATALQLLHEAEQQLVPTPVFLNHSIHALKARVWIRQGKLDVAQRWARQQGLSPDGDITYLREYEYLTFTLLQIALYQAQPSDILRTSTHNLLDRLYATTHDSGRIAHVIEVFILRALMYTAQHEIPLALNALHQALVLAEPESYIRLFVDGGQPIADLLREAEAQVIMPNYVHQLLAAFDAPTPPPPAAQALIDPLSDRELDVLRLLHTDLSGPEIARQLVVSLSTMRTHTRSIYSKLDVNNRRAAVRRAQELALL